MWCHTYPAVDQCTHGRRHLHRCDLKGLPETHRRQFYRTDVFFLVHDRPCLARQIDPCQIHQSKLLKVFTELIHTEPESDIDKYRVAGILNSLHKRLRSMSAHFMTANLPVFHHPVSRALKGVIQLHCSGFQACGGSDDLKSRSRLISIIDAPVSPHLIQQFLFFLRILRICCRLLFRICCQKFLCQCKRIIQIKFRHIHHRQYFPVLWIHQQNRDSVRLLFFHHFLRRLLSIFLNIIIQTKFQCISRHRFDPVFCNPLQLNPTGICRCEDHSVLSFQIFLIFHFQSDDPLIISSGKTKHF